MGNFFQKLTDRVSLVATDSLWLEDAAIQQLKTTAQLPGMQQVIGLPDLHPGRGYPVGAAFFTSERLYPALVGNDIGCGMSLWQTDLLASKIKLDKLDRQIACLDDAIDADEWKLLFSVDATLADRLQILTAQLDAAKLDFFHLKSLGTIGGGNHFAELQFLDKIHDESLLAKTPIHPKQLLLLVHSGSRGLGQLILRAHVDAFGHDGLATESQEATAYLRQHAAALEFARLNRNIIALRILQRVRSGGAPILDIHHNTVTSANFSGKQGWLHRKGANPSDQGFVMLPGSRGDYSYLLAPTQSDTALASLAHGAGRKWQRADCKARLIKLASPTQLSRTNLGSRVICEDRALIYEEAPQAYKNIDSVLDCLVGAGLADLVARTRPILTYKTRGESRE